MEEEGKEESDALSDETREIKSPNKYTLLIIVIRKTLIRWRQSTDAESHEETKRLILLSTEIPKLADVWVAHRISPGTNNPRWASRGWGQFHTLMCIKAHRRAHAHVGNAETAARCEAIGLSWNRWGLMAASRLSPRPHKEPGRDILPPYHSIDNAIKLKEEWSAKFPVQVLRRAAVLMAQ